MKLKHLIVPFAYINAIVDYASLLKTDIFGEQLIFTVLAIVNISCGTIYLILMATENRKVQEAPRS